MASGSGTYMESLLAECGFRNIMSPVDRKWIKIALNSTQANDAYALPERPEVILLPSEPYHFGDVDRDYFVDLGFRREEVTLVDGVVLSWWLSRTVEALEHFRALRLALT